MEVDNKEEFILDAKEGIYKLMALINNENISSESLNKISDMLKDFSHIINDVNIDSELYIGEKWDSFCKKYGKKFNIILEYEDRKEIYTVELRYEGMLSFYFYMAYSNDDKIKLSRFYNIGSLKYILYPVEDNIVKVVENIYYNFSPKNDYFVNKLAEAVYYYFKHKKNDIRGMENIWSILNISIVQYRGSPDTSLLNKLNIDINDSPYKNKVKDILSYDIVYPPWFLDYIYSKMPIKVDAGFLPYLRDMAYLIMIALSTDVLDDDIGYANIFLYSNDVNVNTKDNFAKIYDELSEIKDKLNDINMYILALSLIPEVYNPYNKYDLPIEALSSIAFSIIYKYIDVLIAVYYIYNEVFVLSLDEFIKYIKEVVNSIPSGETTPILDILIRSSLPMDPTVLYKAIEDILQTANNFNKVFYVDEELFPLLNIHSFKLMFSDRYTYKLTMPINMAYPEILPGVLDFKFIKKHSGTLDMRYTNLINKLFEYLINIVISNKYQPIEEFTRSKYALEYVNHFIFNLMDNHESYVYSKFGKNYNIKLIISNLIMLYNVIILILSSNIKLFTGDDDYISDPIFKMLLNLFNIQSIEKESTEKEDDLLKSYKDKLLKIMYLINCYYGISYKNRYNLDSPFFLKKESDMVDLIEDISKNDLINEIPTHDLMNLKYNIYNKYLFGRDLLSLYEIYSKNGSSLYQRLDELNKYVKDKLETLYKCKSEIIKTCESTMDKNYYVRYSILLNKFSSLSDKYLIPAFKTYPYYALLKSAVFLTYLYKEKEFISGDTLDVDKIISHVGNKLTININKAIECMESKSYDLYDLYEALYGCYANYIGSLVYDSLFLTVMLTCELVSIKYEEQLKTAVDNIKSGKSQSETIEIDMMQTFNEAMSKLEQLLDTLINKLNEGKTDSEEYEEDNEIAIIKNTLDVNFESAYELFVMYMMSDMILAKLLYNMVNSNITRDKVVEFANILKALSPENYEAVLTDILNKDDYKDNLEEWFKNLYILYI